MKQTNEQQQKNNNKTDTIHTIQWNNVYDIVKLIFTTLNGYKFRKIRFSTITSRVWDFVTSEASFFVLDSNTVSEETDGLGGTLGDLGFNLLNLEAPILEKNLQLNKRVKTLKRYKLNKML